LSARRLAADADAALLDEARRRSTALLRANLTPAGILAASPSERADARGYTAIFGRDAAVCAIGMALSDDPVLRDAAAVGLETLAAHQAPNGQLPKFVDVRRREADFWYLGCIDSTLWWLIGIHCIDRIRGTRTLARRHASAIRAASGWLAAQEHQRFFLLQQNEASDWADIMPRSGFVLYTNALWYHVKQRFGLARAADTHASFNALFHPFSAALAEYRRARLLSQFALTRARNRALYLSFVNFSFFGEEGDVFGNVLAVLMGLADERATVRTLRALKRAAVDAPFPVRATVEPIEEASFLWRPYMSRHEQNFAWQYHNGGIWPFVGGFWVAALAHAGREREARAALAACARANKLEGWRFSEWLHGRTHACEGMAGQSWNAAAWLMADAVVSRGARPFAA
jgi:glycogen debranching enzyme